MTDRRPCRRCARAIDAVAGRCPFCNWDQTQAPPPPEQQAAVPVQVANYKPPEEFDFRKLIAMGAGIVVMLVGAFLIGMVINKDGAPERAPESLEEQAAEHNVENLKQKRADTPLVPAGQGGIDQTPITSAPVALAPGQAPDDYQRTDATAVSAEEYAQIAKRAEAENRKRMTVLVDPRSLTGPAYAQSGAPVRRTAAARPPLSSTLPGNTAPQQQGQLDRPRAVRGSGVRTRPVPQYQPLPRLSGNGTARLTVMVGTDGRVKDVNIEQMLTGGNTAALVSAVQNWRFKPATANGEPVSAPYSVEISLRP
jgi:TonB family protein